mgnify:CR=1 FL=1
MSFEVVFDKIILEVDSGYLADGAGQESRTDDRGYAIEQHSRDCEVQLFDIVRHSEVARVSKAAIFVVKSDGLCHDDEWGEHT